MSIKKLLLLGFCTTIGLSLLIGIVGYKSAYNASEQINELIHADMAFREQTLTIRNLIQRHRRYEKNIFINIGNAEQQKSYFQKLEHVSQETQQELKTISQLEPTVVELTTEERSAIQNLEPYYKAYLQGVKQVARQAMSQDITPSEANERMMPFKKPFHDMEDSLRELGESSHNILIAEGKESMDLLHESELMLIGICCLVLVFGIAIAAYIFRAINGPLTQLTSFANRVADGNLNAETESSFTGEMAVLHNSINRMILVLKEKLGFAEGVLNAIPSPCGIVGPDFTMLWVNQQLLNLLEKKGSPESYKGIVSGELYWDDATKETLSDRAIKERKPLHLTCERPLKSGESLMIDATTTPVYDLNGEILGSVSFWYDLTEVTAQKKIIEEQNERISNAAQEASSIADQVAAEASQLEMQVNQTTQGTAIQSDRIGETAAAVEEMNATTLEVASNAARAAEAADTSQHIASKGAEIVQDVVQTTEEVQQYAQEMRSTITELGTQAQSIGNIINVINDIADQTNLLALNAAIEAARAGEAGRGFAVVADEVRKLAEKTMQATNEVETVVRGIQTSSGSTLEQMEKVASHIEHNTELTVDAGEALAQIVEAGTQTADRVRSIATASEQQSAASEQIARSSDEVNALAQETSQGMQEASQAVTALAMLSQKLEAVMREIQQ
ncbi:methyl-accepting chemotaxis protein [Halodesulfovibrio sp.]|jgi:methyl-accepting chemotaxis protein|uniref:methyl-accepting chemotaxis protein n=1 Tax=Halodesulfovibrio sp. TaxID=1912772 RepID=UPI0025D6F76D|nr:methyl-accepting chemotaxis protein [Halodesulfovibrio sp.]MCT4625381.1 methyl-accepting chemotaxis protein [Halodesulfovibrio sp.]